MRAATRERTIRESTIRLGRDAVAEGWRGTRRFIQALRNMVARDGVEPPTPAFSGPPTELAKWHGISGSH
jgi:hypothetical protein